MVSGAKSGAHIIPTGGLVGRSWQFGQVYTGLEADVEKTTLDGVVRAKEGRIEVSSGYDASLRGRLGYIFGNAMVYLTAGGALAGARIVNSGAIGDEGHSQYLGGWTAGFGGEYALDAHWTGRLEYRYTNYASVSIKSLVVFPGFTATHGLSDQTVRAAMTYRFLSY